MTPAELAALLETHFPGLFAGTQVSASGVRATLVDGTFVDIWYNERGKYSYHWERGDGKAYRFNNAPHHPDVPTHPHHLHAGSEADVLPSNVRGVAEEDVEAVFRFIERTMR